MKKSYLFSAVIISILLSNIIFAQIHVNNKGNVGIGTENIEDFNKTKIIVSGLNTEVQSRGIYIENNMQSRNMSHLGIFIKALGTKGYGGIFHGGYAGINAYAGYPNTTQGSRYGVITTGKNGLDHNHGILAIGEGGRTAYGIEAKASNGRKNYGVYTQATGGNYSYGIYAKASSARYANYAGYFSGNVSYTGSLTKVSDRKFKENITDLRSVTEKLKEVKVKTYNYKQNSKMSLPTGKKFGVIAQEIEQVFPELVSEIIPPSDMSEMSDSSAVTNYNFAEDYQQTEKTYKAVDYTELIPILLKGFQEQQETIEEQQYLIDELLDRVTRLENKKYKKR